MREDGFINPIDTTYLESYGVENLINIIKREDMNRFQNLLDDQTEIKRYGRANAIDKLFGVAQNLRIEDK